MPSTTSQLARVFLDLFRFRGPVDRGYYAVAGLAGFAVKYAVDTFVALVVFGRHWPWHSYWRVPLDLANEVRTADALLPLLPFLLTMIAVSLPFVWIGVALTLRRLRTAGLPSWLVACFFLPFLNLLFFLLLAVLPPHDESDGAGDSSWLDRLVPRDRGAAVVVGAGVANLLAFPLGLLSIFGFGTYGFGIFLALPFLLGMVSVRVANQHDDQPSFAEAIGISTVAVATGGALLLVFALEGAICLLMAAPLALALAWVGGAVGHSLSLMRPRAARHLFPGLLIVLPFAFVAENAVLPEPPLFEVTTTIEIDAPPAEVWQHVVAFTELPPPEEWIFKLGIAYPIRAEIDGQGVGAERRCVFSTGAFVEPIEVWDEPRELAFSVLDNPPPLDEWTLYDEIHPPHLEGFMESEGGRFLLHELPGGRTRIEGTTWYRHSLWPATYWKWWSDAIVHRIHLRVLRHVKSEAEAGYNAPT